MFPEANTYRGFRKMFEQFVLGAVQGFAEWLPVSSEGMIILTKKNLLHSTDTFGESIRQALFLHLGTFLAAFIYFFKDVIILIKGLFAFKSQSIETRNTIIFLFVATFVSGLLGLALLKGVGNMADQFDSNGRIITGLIGFLLIGTGLLELRAKHSGHRFLNNITLTDGLLLGIAQGFAALPGFSRSGLTVSALLLRKFDKACALKLSFLMSLPIVLAGNIVLHASELHFSMEGLVGLASAFVFGLATIHILLKVAEKINFGIFVLLFGIITIISCFI